MFKNKGIAMHVLFQCSCYNCKKCAKRIILCIINMFCQKLVVAHLRIIFVNNVEKIPHIKGRLLDQAVIIFSCIPFKIGKFS